MAGFVGIRNPGAGEVRRLEKVLGTPEKIRNLQRKLYEKAKKEPDFRFYLLYDKIWRPDILRHAYELAFANAGAPGVDGETFDQIEAAGVENWLARLGEALRTKTHQPQAVREPSAFGYRPKRGATEAIEKVMVLLRQGFTDVVDADLSKYLDPAS